MSSVEDAFAQNGPMKSKNIHVGNVIVYNDLTVEDKATFEEDVEIGGKVYAKEIHIGETVITERDFDLIRNGVKGAVDDASEPPSNKRLKLTEKTNYDNTGFVEEKDLSDHPNYLQAKGVVAQDHVFSHTGFLTSEKY